MPQYALGLRPGWEKLTMGGADRSGAGLVGQTGGQVVHDGLQLGAAGLELALAFAQGKR
jgi:hypothetical protein